MTTKTQERLKAQAKVLKALAHPTRLLLVEELARKTRCVCELRDAAGLDISTVSKHLSLLRNAGIVEDEMVMGFPAEMLPEIVDAVKIITQAPGSSKK